MYRSSFGPMGARVASRSAHGFRRCFQRLESVDPSRRLARFTPRLVRAAWVAVVGPDTSMEDRQDCGRGADCLVLCRDDLCSLHGGIVSPLISHFTAAER